MQTNNDFSLDCVYCQYLMNLIIISINNRCLSPFFNIGLYCEKFFFAEFLRLCKNGFTTDKHRIFLQSGFCSVAIPGSLYGILLYWWDISWQMHLDSAAHCKRRLEELRHLQSDKPVLFGQILLDCHLKSF